MTTGSDQPEHSRQSCSACRGSGRVISNLGGEAHDVTCPWCEGTGEFKAGHDAQEHVSERSGDVATGRPAPKTAE